MTTKGKLGLVCGIAAMAVVAIAGCGALPFGLGHRNPNPAFQTRLNQMEVPISTKFDAKTVSESTYTHLKVYDSKGHEVVLDATKTPIFFEAYWCPHCQRTLKMWSQNLSAIGQLPVIVSLGFASGSSVADAVSVSETEMKAFGLGDAKVYYYLGTPSNIVPGFPTLVFEHQGALMMLQGEHSLAIWEDALQPSKQS